MLDERWAAIKGYEGLYEISDRGRIKSFYSDPPQILTCNINTPGYVQVGLYKNKKLSLVKVHALVLTTFISARPLGLVCDHLDGDKENNHVANLEWVTQKENVQRGGMIKNRNGCFLTDQQVLAIREKGAKGATHLSIAKDYFVDSSTICRILSRKTWNHI